MGQETTLYGPPPRPQTTHLCYDHDGGAATATLKFGKVQNSLQMVGGWVVTTNCEFSLAGPTTIY